MKKYSAALFMLSLGIACLVIHFVFGWNAYQNDAAEHGSTAQWGDYFLTWIRDVFENLQSEFIQLFFQFLLIAGAFKFINIQAYEEDIEGLSEQLSRIESRLNER
jgi:hypothetical protein